MAFVVEDGSGLPNSNSYVSVSEADDFLADRGNVFWAALSTPEKEQALVRATDYVDQRFGARYRGFRQSKSQALEWPRLSAFDNDDFLLSGIDAIPRQLRKAVTYYGVISAQYIILNPQQQLLPIPAPPFASVNPTTGAVISNASGQLTEFKNKVDVIEESKKFSTTDSMSTKPGSSQSSVVSAQNLPEYPIADEWLKELLKSSQSNDLGRG